MNCFKQWPLGINEEMDNYAIKYNLSHWSCVSPRSSEWWVRKDGWRCAPFEGSYDGKWTNALRDFDKLYPMEEEK